MENRRRRSSSQQTTETFVAAAMDLFHSKGYNATGIQEIADRAQRPKGSFYNHFSSKSEIAVHVIGEYHRSLGAAASAASATRSSALERIRAGFRGLHEEYLRHAMTRGCLLGNIAAEVADHDDEVRGSLSDAFRTWGEDLAALVEQAQEAGEVRGDIVPRDLASLLISMWEGALLQSRATASPDPVSTFLDTALSTLIGPVPGAAGSAAPMSTGGE